MTTIQARLYRGARPIAPNPAVEPLLAGDSVVQGVSVETETRSLDQIAGAPLDPRYPDGTKVERLGDQSEQVR